LDRERYDHLLTLARDAHFNLLRVWGGGLFETDDFYELCDEYGILVWQEFLSNLDFSGIDKKNFYEAIHDVVLRIRNHPSLTFYCGGNEFDPDDVKSKEIIDSIESLLKELDPDREFHRASPYKGDDHYWAVWHGLKPYTDYRKVRPFRSEAGINTFPVLENYKKFTPVDKLWPLDKFYIEYRGSMQQSLDHINRLSRYTNEFGIPQSIEEFIRNSQYYQCIGNEFNIEFCRSHKFRNSGILIWQYNDIWPCISWSLVDWYGTPKPGYYFVKRAFRPLHISADYEKYLWNAGEVFKADIFILNDLYDTLPSHQYEVSILDINGNVLDTQTGIISIPANSSQKVDSIAWNIPDNFVGKTIFLSVRLRDKESNLISESLYSIAIRKNLDLVSNALTPSPEDPNAFAEYIEIFSEMNQMPKIKPEVKLSYKKVKIGKDSTGYLRIMVENKSSNLLFYTRIYIDDETDKFSVFYDDNYINLLPGEKKETEAKIKLKNNLNAPINSSVKISGWNCVEVSVPFKFVKK
jgi:beta-mannosidase